MHTHANAHTHMKTEIMVRCMRVGAALDSHVLSSLVSVYEVRTYANIGSDEGACALRFACFENQKQQTQEHHNQPHKINNA